MRSRYQCNAARPMTVISRESWNVGKTHNSGGWGSNTRASLNESKKERRWQRVKGGSIGKRE